MNFDGEPNPYAAPNAPADKVVLPTQLPQVTRLRRWMVLQCVVMVCALGAQYASIETIMVSGPIFALVGLVIFIMAARARRSIGIWFGVSSMLFAVSIFGLINLADWGPQEARYPVILLSWIYAVVISPLIAFALKPQMAPPE